MQLLQLPRTKRANVVQTHTPSGELLLPHRIPTRRKFFDLPFSPVTRQARRKLPFANYRRRRKIAALMEELDRVEYSRLRRMYRRKMRKEMRRHRVRTRQLTARQKRTIFKAAYLRARLTTIAAQKGATVPENAPEVRPLDL
jgi:hypothetical protein